ncbi:MAG: hypothetical protein QOE98_2116, partial [Gaiellaceae bacterium]|nr:hypothetical protein [Gaiellaceae bacterium]
LAAACPAIDPELSQIALRYIEDVAGVFVHHDPGLPADASASDD